MTDAQFYAEIQIRAYLDQIDGYPFGHPRRINFKPIIGVFFKPDGTYERMKMLAMYQNFTDEQRKLMLDDSPWDP